MNALYVEGDPREADRTRSELSRHAPHVNLEVVATLAEARARLAGGGDYEVVLVGHDSGGDGGADLLTSVYEQGFSVPVIFLTGAAGVAAAARLFGSGGSAASDEATRRLLESAGQDARFPALVENSPHCIHEIDHEGRFASMNYAGRRVLGIGDDAVVVVGTPFLDVVDRADRPRVQALLRRALRGETTQFEFSSPAGGRFASNFVPLRDDAGGVERLMGITVDISGRQRVEEALQRQREIAARLVEIAPAIILLLAPDGAIRHVNPYFEQLTGYRLDEVRGKEWFSTFLPERDRDRIRDIFKTATDGVATRGNVNPIVTRSGEEREIEWYDQAMRDGQGRVTGLVTIGQDVTERRRAELEIQERDEALRASAMRLNEAQRIAGMGSCEFDLAANVLTWSDEVFRILEIDPARSDASWEAFLDAVHPDDRPMVDGAHRISVETRTPHEIAYRLLMADGRVKYVQEHCETFYGPGGEPLRSLGTVQDITERKLAEEALRESQRRYERVVEHISDALIIDDVSGRVVYANQRFREMFGFADEGLEGVNLEDYIAPEWRDLLRARHERRVRGEDVPDSFEYQGMRRDGTAIWLEVVVVPIVENGNIAGTQSTIRDITDRKLTEDVLRLLSTGVAHHSDAAFFNEIAARTAQLLGAEIGFVGRLLPGARPRIRTLGLSVEGELLPVMEYDPAGTPCEQIAGIEACVIPDGVQQMFPSDRYLADKGVSAYAGLPLLDRDGAPVGHVGVMSRRPFAHPERVEAALRLVAVRAAAEIERVRAEEEHAALEARLREAQKMEAIGTLAGGIAHDFNNILTAIIGNAELAAMDIGVSHPAAEMMDEIRLASRRAKELVSQILAFSQRHEQPQTTVALRPLVEEVVQLLHAALPPAVELATAFGDGDPAVLADPTQMHQVLMNLCTNAWQAMEGAPGRIEIRLDEVTLDAAGARRHTGLRAGRHARLVVSDTGKGMDAATIERIFEPFFTTKSVGQGTGLGLSVAHGIVRAHRGAISVRSEPGGGSVFEVLLPLGAMAEPATPREAPALPRGAGQHLLYLDDEPALVRVTTRILEAMGYRVTAFTDAAEALAAFAASPGQFDAVLTDLSMPGVSGLDVIRDVARLRPGLPIALTSGLPTDEVHASAKALGCREVINKPASIEDIAHALQRLFSAG